MKSTIKDILDDMIKNPVSEMTVLKNAYEENGIPDANFVVGELLSWQKLIGHFMLDLFKNKTEDKILLSEELMRKRFNAFFEHSPALSEIFTLEDNEVRLSSTLTEEEIAEIRMYIGEHYKMSMHSKLGGTTYF